MRSTSLLATTLATIAIAHTTAPLRAQSSDTGKVLIEEPLKKRLVDSLRRSQKVAVPDTRKFRVEHPIKERLAKHPLDGKLENRKVAPGFVRWHASLEAALVRAKTSGKPVLLFQLLGKLDDEFC